jgi:hypothetical protein
MRNMLVVLVFCRIFASARVLFVSDNQALAAGIPAAHDRVIQISLQRATTQERFLLKDLN